MENAIYIVAPAALIVGILLRVSRQRYRKIGRVQGTAIASEPVTDHRARGVYEIQEDVPIRRTEIHFRQNLNGGDRHSPLSPGRRGARR